jgi:hypothetical protein
MAFSGFGQAAVNACYFWIFGYFLRLYIWMVAFKWGAPCNIWTFGSWVMEFLKFQPKFGHALSHCLCSRLKLPISRGGKEGGLLVKKGLQSQHIGSHYSYNASAFSLARETVRQHCFPSLWHGNLYSDSNHTPFTGSYFRGQIQSKLA